MSTNEILETTSTLPLWSYQPQPNSKIAVRMRRHVEEELFARSVKDESFRARLTADPVSVLEGELGARVAPGTRVQVLQEAAAVAWLVLPWNPYGDLPRSELESAYGLSLEDIAGWMLEQQRTGWPAGGRSAALVARAWEDEPFRRELLERPGQVLARELDVDLPEGLEVRVVAESPGELFLVLPAMDRQVTSRILGERVSGPELEAVAGSYLEVAVADTHVFTGSCCITTPSDRNLKEGFGPVDVRQVLDKIAALRIETWSYKAEGPGVRHMGPMAQDFHAHFGLGRDDRHIDVVDAQGAALAAIQALLLALREKEARIDGLEARILGLEARLAAFAGRRAEAA